jgi:hypothetical protein
MGMKKSINENSRFVYQQKPLLKHKQTHLTRRAGMPESSISSLHDETIVVVASFSFRQRHHHL